MRRCSLRLARATGTSFFWDELPSDVRCMVIRCYIIVLSRVPEYRPMRTRRVRVCDYLTDTYVSVGVPLPAGTGYVELEIG